jgi:hypothetical protein
MKPSCPLGVVPASCSPADCEACRDDFEERAALIADGCGVSQEEGTRRAVEVIRERVGVVGTVDAS